MPNGTYRSRVARLAPPHAIAALAQQSVAAGVSAVGRFDLLAGIRAAFLRSMDVMPWVGVAGAAAGVVAAAILLPPGQ